ncbi:MAG: hypothetical protein WBQ03_09770 [Candidatus Sulfotelmatobacter sp.]
MTSKAFAQVRILIVVTLFIAALTLLIALVAQAQQKGAAPSAGLSFEPAVTYGSGGYIAQGVAIADLNGDHISDIVVENWWNPSDLHGAVGVLLGKGDGTFQPAVAYETAGTPNALLITAQLDRSLCC